MINVIGVINPLESMFYDFQIDKKRLDKKYVVFKIQAGF